MEFTRQDWALIHDLIGLAWQSGAVKSPQQAQGIEQLRAKVVEKLDKPSGPETIPAKKEDSRGGK